MATLQELSKVNKDRADETAKQLKKRYEELKIDVGIEVIPMTFVVKVTDKATGNELIEHYLYLAKNR